MFPNLKRTTFENHIYKDLEVPVLKQAAIYGANGSGKSNLLESIKFIKSFAVDKYFRIKIPIALNKFLLAGENNNEPICISIEFFHNETYFIYEVEINEEEIHKEALSVSGIGTKDNQLIYSRSKNEFIPPLVINEDIKKAINQLIMLNPLSSLLSLNNEFPIFTDERAKVAFDWFNIYIEVLSLRRVSSSLLDEMLKNTELLNFTNHLFAKIGLGIEQVELEQAKLNDILADDTDANKMAKEEIANRLKNGNYVEMDNDKILLSIKKENEEQIVTHFIFKQIGLNNYIGNMMYGSQSDGTARVLNLIPALYDIIHNDCVYLIDEIENSIHPSLMFALMKFFSETDTKGQLIYTTHETELLNQQELMRPDEVWFTEKQKGTTKLYSLNDFKEHNTINIKNGYLEGRYGAIPFIGNLSE